MLEPDERTVGISQETQRSENLCGQTLKGNERNYNYSLRKRGKPQLL